MATTRSSGYVVTAAVWNAVLSKLTDDGNTYSGAFNGSSVIGTTGSFSSTLAVTGTTTLSGVATANAASTRGVVVTRSGATETGIQVANGSAGYGIVVTTAGVLAIQNDGTATPRIEVSASGGTVNFVAASGVTNTHYYSSATAQPGFLAYNSADDTSVANNTTIDFDTEVYDDGSDFSSDTFTAPVAGRYLLSACVLLENTSGGAITMQAVIKPSNHSDGILIGFRENVANGEQIAFSGACPVDMDAGDTAVVKYFGGGTCTVSGSASQASQRSTWFGGRLLP